MVAMMTEQERNELAERIRGAVLIPDRYDDKRCDNPEDVEVTENSDGSLSIEITRMYDSWSLTFDHLAAIAEVVGTDKIDLGDTDEVHRGGCESCDYGSAHGHCITVRR